MKALEYLKKEREIKKHCADVAWGYYDKDIDEAIKELEAIKKNIDTSIEEIEYALAKPEYASNYLNNALRYLKERL